VRDGIEELLAAYRKAGLTKEQFLGPKYYRLRTVRGLQERGLVNAELRRTHA
jgi:hypothetical protein